MTRTLVTVLPLLLFLCGLPGCTGGSESDPANSAENRIRRGNIEAPATLDPWLAEDIHTFNVLLDLYEGLVAENAAGQLVPGVAQSWSISADGLVYTFKLRDNALWSDGSRVLAEHFVNGLRRMASPDTTSGYAFLLEPIVGFSDVKNGNMAAASLGVRSTDRSTIEIRLSRPSPHFLGILAMPLAFPLPAGAHDKAWFGDPARFVGNGAYVLERQETGQTIQLSRNPAYWDSDSVAVETIEYIAIADENAELNMYRSGELDITGTIPPSHIPIVLEDSPEEVRIAPSLALYYFAFDLTEPPLDELNLRRALSMAIDRQQLVKLLGRGEQPAYGIVPPGVANHEAAAYSWRNISDKDRFNEARNALEEAGYGPDNPLHLKLTYDTGGVHEKVALAVSAMWQDVLRINVELEKKEWKYFLDTREDRAAWQVMRFSWFGDYNDASTFTDIFHSASPQNLPLFRNTGYDTILEAAAMEVNPEKRSAIMRRAEEILLVNYPIAPLYFYTSRHMVKPRIAGFVNNPLDRHPSKYLSIR